MATVFEWFYMFTFADFLFCFVLLSCLSSSERGKKHTALFRACFDANIQLSLFFLFLFVAFACKPLVHHAVALIGF